MHPLQYGVACRAGAEKVIHQVRECMEEHWMDEDFVCFKVDMKNAFNLVSRQTVLEEFTLSYSHGFHTAMGPILCYVTLLAELLQNVECSRVIPWALCCFL